MSWKSSLLLWWSSSLDWRSVLGEELLAGVEGEGWLGGGGCSLVLHGVVVGMVAVMVGVVVVVVVLHPVLLGRVVWVVAVWLVLVAIMVAPQPPLSPNSLPGVNIFSSSYIFCLLNPSWRPGESSPHTP